MKIVHATIQNFGSLRDSSFEGHPLNVFIGSNGQGKSLIVEALYRFFTDFSVVGGASSLPVSDILWQNRVTDSPIKFEITIELSEDEIRKVLPFDAEVLKYLKVNVPDNFSKISIKRSLEASGNWKTEEISWAGISLITNDTFVKQEVIQEVLSSLIANEAKKYKMYFFSKGMSKDNLVGDRLIVKEGSKKAFQSNEALDALVRKGLIEGKYPSPPPINMQEWAKAEGYQIVKPSVQILEIQPIPPKIIQQINTTMASMRGKFKLIPAARDDRGQVGGRAPLVEAPILKSITDTSINRKRSQEIKWERYRSKMEKLLQRRLEPNPSQILVKEGDLGLNVGQIGGGEQSLIGLVWETLDAANIYAIEEPENHLYPRMQKELFDYFRELSKQTQVIICTHSPIFASRSDICGVYLVSKDEYQNTQIEAVNESNVHRMIDELGIRASYQFEYDNVVFVEGDDDVKIFNAIAQRILENADTTIGFIDAGGWNNMDYYANARILTTKRVKVGIAVIFDGDTEKEERNRKIKEKLVKDLKIGEDSIFTLKENSIEAYLLVGNAVKRAFPEIELSKTEIRKLISQHKSKKNKKKVLSDILKKGGIAKYSGEIGAKIVQNMTDKEIDNELKTILKSIVGLEKPPKSEGPKVKKQPSRKD